MPAPSLEQFVGLFREHGGTDEDYLRVHFRRFLETRQRFLANWKRASNARLLDVGAHWLHQSLLYAVDGFEVTALDLPATLEAPEVRRLAAAHGIRLAPNPDLERPTALAGVADDTFEVVLITEVIEHLAFNPVALWRELYRVLRPGGRVVLTTPNFYALRTMLRRNLRALGCRGGGVSVDDVLALRTLGHHWKEYSARELLRYFALLSPDFSVGRIGYTEDYMRHGVRHLRGLAVLAIERCVPPLRPDIYCEVDLPAKRSGIVIEPHW